MFWPVQVHHSVQQFDGTDVGDWVDIMQLLLIGRAYRKTLLVSPSAFLLCVGLLSVAVGGYFFQLGLQHGLDRQSIAASTEHAELEQHWYRELDAQRLLLDETREEAQRHLDALAVHLGRIQARSLRLDALGARLADAADVEELHFDILDAPGLGGVPRGEWQEAFEIDDLFDSMQVLHNHLDDRGGKLTALESLLLDRDLQRDRVPRGRPVEDAWVSSTFGRRHDPFSGRLEHHAGIDFSGRSGSPVLAVAGGMVTRAGRRYSYGYAVDVYHGDGLSTRYAHNKKNLVGVGDRVKKGQVIALMGSTGRSTGTHLHFEVLKNGRQVNPLKFTEQQ